MKLTPKKPKCS